MTQTIFWNIIGKPVATKNRINEGDVSFYNYVETFRKNHGWNARTESV